MTVLSVVAELQSNQIAVQSIIAVVRESLGTRLITVQERARECGKRGGTAGYTLLKPEQLKAVQKEGTTCREELLSRFRLSVALSVTSPQALGRALAT